MLGQVVVDAQGVTLGVAEELAHGTARIRGDVLQRGQLRRRRRNDGRVGHGTGILQRLHHLSHSGTLLPYGDIETEDLLALLVDDRIDGDRGLAGLPVADDQLSLTAADRNHGVDRLDAGLKRLLDRSPVHNAGGKPLDGPRFLRVDRPLAVDRLAEGVHHPPNQRIADRHGGDPARPLDEVSLFDRLGLAEQDRADVVLLEVQDQAKDLVGELQKLAGHRLFQPINTGNPVTRFNDGTDLGHIDGRLVAG